MCNYDQTRGWSGIEERGMRGASRDCQGRGGRGAGPVSVLAAFSFFPSLPPNPQFQKGFQLERRGLAGKASSWKTGCCCGYLVRGAGLGRDGELTAAECGWKGQEKVCKGGGRS